MCKWLRHAVTRSIIFAFLLITINNVRQLMTDLLDRWLRLSSALTIGNGYGRAVTCLRPGGSKGHFQGPATILDLVSAPHPGSVIDASQRVLLHQ